MPCYKFASGVEPNTFIFPTDSGWLYSLSFVDNSYLFQGNSILKNDRLSFEIIFGRSELDKGAKGKDDVIAATILTIICKQFEAFGKMTIYYFLCDMSDKRAAGRSLLFTKWYESSSLPDWELTNYELEDANDSTATYYAGLIVHTEHPNHKLIPDAFEKFLEEDISAGKFVRRR